MKKGMKKITTIFLSLVVVLSSLNPVLNISAIENTLDGSGTKESPWLISDAEDFVVMSNLINSDPLYADDYYQMTNDIDFTGVTMTAIGKNNHFSGVFDGQLYAVKNLTINDTSENTGLFAFVENGTIKNLGITSSSITGGKKVGAIAGRTMYATFTNCYSKATVSGTNDVGGIVGMFNSSVMNNCYSFASVTSSAEAGGIAGSLNTSLDTSRPVKLDNVYSYANVKGGNYSGSIAAWSENMDPLNTPVYVTNAYYCGSDGAFGNYGSGNTGYTESKETGVSKLDEVKMKDGTLLSRLNEALKGGYQSWITGNDLYPEFTRLEFEFIGEGTESSPFIIDSVKDLLEMAEAASNYRLYAEAHYKLTANLDLSDTNFNGISAINGFSGTFDGNGHVLKNVEIDTGSANNSGIFHSVNGGTIKNLGVESGTIEGADYVGGIIGNANDATIINCFNNATIKGNNDVGGLVGTITNSNILNSFNNGLVRILGKSSIGGLAGSAGNTTLENCYNIGQVNVGTYTGKIVGWANNLTLENVYYDQEAAIKNQPIGNFKEFNGIVAMTESELTDENFVDTLNTNLKEGYMEWVYGEDKIVRLKDFEKTSQIDIFMASIDEVTIKDNRVQKILSEDGAYEAVVYGSDHKSVIDLKGNVYQPLTTQKVLLILNIVDTATGEVVEQLDRNIEVTVEGKYSNTGVNECPNVVPGLREWYGLEGNFEVTENTRIIYKDDEMSEMASRIQRYLKDMLDLDLEVVKGNGTTGDIILKYVPDRYDELQDEGYAISITNQIVIESPTEIGMLYGGISVMQILSQDDTHTKVPKGFIRDYPQYEMRGGMIDVARKYFDIEYVEEMGKYMSWFKLNTLSLHINDNGGQYTASFVVESKKYPELNSYNGEYVWSQDDYRQLQKTLKEFGVNVITEIDTPGHATVFAKVNSTIVNGANFNLNEYYDESLALVEDVFDEFLDGDDPVFQNAIVHIGTDESSNTKENMRKYIGDLSQYMLAKDNVDKVVFWGNLSLYYGETEIDPENVITQIWDSADFRADEALAQGFEVINSTSNMMYLVPNRSSAFEKGTYFNGYIDMAKFYDTWKGASDFDTHNLNNPYEMNNGFYYAEHDILKGNPKILGTLFCDWNDTGIGHDYDIMELLMAYIAGVSEKCWYGDTDRFESGEEFVEAFNKVGNYAAYANPRYRVDSDSTTIVEFSFDNMKNNIVTDRINGYDAKVINGTIKTENDNNVLALDGTTSLQLPFSGVGYPYTAVFDIYLDGEQRQDTVLFSCDDCIIYLDYQGKGVCFESNNYVYSFNVDIPIDQWVEVKISSQSPSFVHDSSNITVLTIDGVEYIPSNITNSRNQSRSTILGTEEMFKGIVGFVDNLSISNKYSYDPILDVYKFEGEGTEENPYLIQSSIDLKMFSLFVNAGMYQDAHFRMTEDIDMSNVNYKYATKFSGVFDGNGHIITNLTINEPSSTDVGLIGLLDGGTIMNLGIEDSAITAHTHVGALAGKTMNAVIMNCYSNATVKVSGAKDVGGIVGMFNSSQMNNCYSAATVNATQESAGGLTGSLNSSLNLNNLVSVDNVYSIATVSAPKNVGIITGWDEGYSTETPVNVTNAYYFGDKNASGNYAARNATLLTEVQITDGTLLTYLNKDLKDRYEPWVEDAQGYPSFRYQIYDVSELEALLAAASKIDSTIYTEETINTLEEAIKKGEDSLIPESQEQLDNAVKALEEALNLLVYKPADYSEVDKAIAKASALDKDLYKDYSLVEIAINAIVRGKNITEQKEVDAMAKAIEDAISALEYKDADYSKVNDAVTKANGLNKDLYKDFSAVEKALDAVNPDLDITQQEEVDAMAKAIEDAIRALEYKDADYSAVEKAKEKVPADLSIYTEESVKALNDALAGVVEGKNITEQEEVDAMAKAIENAINGLVKKDTGKPEDPTTPTDPETPSEPEGPNTSDNYHVAVFAGLMILSAGVLAFVLLRKKREARQ